jgi:hypothetical protein
MPANKDWSYGFGSVVFRLLNLGDDACAKLKIIFRFLVQCEPHARNLTGQARSTFWLDAAASCSAAVVAPTAWLNAIARILFRDDSLVLTCTIRLVSGKSLLEENPRISRLYKHAIEPLDTLALQPKPVEKISRKPSDTVWHCRHQEHEETRDTA